jgi:multicomponent Na+:H+ antiporter subunit F
MTLFSALLLWGALPLLLGAAILGFVRLMRGPSLPDRVMAMELMVMAGIGIIAVYAVYTQQSALVDVAMIMALIGFLSTVAFATYVERRV